MTPVRCSQNHFYDSEVYSSCPHCAQAHQGSLPTSSSPSMSDLSAVPVYGSAQTQPVEKKHSIFSRFGKKKENHTNNSYAPTTPLKNVQALDAVTEVLSGSPLSDSGINQADVFIRNANMKSPTYSESNLPHDYIEPPMPDGPSVQVNSASHGNTVSQHGSYDEPNMYNGAQYERIPRPGNSQGQFGAPQPGNAPGQFGAPHPGNAPGQFGGQQPGSAPGQFGGPQPGKAPGQFGGPQPGSAPGQFGAPQPGKAPRQFGGPQPGSAPGQYGGARPEPPRNNAAQPPQGAPGSVQLSNDSKTVAFYDLGETEPVVGWLVCIKGEYLGEGFNLSSGRNSIGRSGEMSVVLAKCTSVARERHAVVTFDPKKRKFYLQPGENASLTYVNDELLSSFVELSAYDIVTFGNEQFVFLPLCGEKFSWDKYID